MNDNINLNNPSFGFDINNDFNNNNNIGNIKNTDKLKGREKPNISINRIIKTEYDNTNNLNFNFNMQNNNVYKNSYYSYRRNSYNNNFHNSLGSGYKIKENKGFLSNRYMGNTIRLSQDHNNFGEKYPLELANKEEIENKKE